MALYSNILIQGGGFAGLTMALLAAQAGKSVTVIDMAGIPERLDSSRDIRTVAISAGSRAILERAGVWNAQDFAQNFPKCPINIIHIMEGAGPEVLLEFDSDEVGNDPFGTIVDNVDLRRALIDAVANNDQITHIMNDSLESWDCKDDMVTARTKEGQALTAQLLIGADGRFSKIRTQAGIGIFGWHYNEKAMVTTIGHEHPHNNVAVERFMDTGPYAVLPMIDDSNGEHRSAIVWTLPKGDARLDNVTQSDIQSLLPSFYGDITWMGHTQAYPLTLQQSYSLIDERVALVADAGHNMHPIAGQGLNVGLRDVVQLADLLDGAKDCGSPELLKRYDRARKADVAGMMMFTDQMNRLFGSKLAPIRFARRFGLKTVSKIQPVKEFFMKRAMGY